MKLLLDENLPHEFRHLLKGHDAFTVQYMGWAGTKNGLLLAKAEAAGFDALITMDQGIQYQQDLNRLPLSLITLNAASNDIDDLRPLIPKLLLALSAIHRKEFIRIG